MTTSFTPPAIVRARRGISSTTALAILSLIGANVIWAGSATASKALIGHVPPLTMASLRVAIAMVVLTAVLHYRGERIATGMAPAMLGLTGVALFCACQNLGLCFADATTTALIGAAIPVLTVVFAVMLLGERLGGARIAGTAISVIGVMVIMLLGSGQLAGVAAIGNALPLASAISFAVYNVLGRRAFGGGHAMALVAGSTRYGLGFLLPFTVVELAHDDIGQVSMPDTLLLLYLGAGCSALAFMLCGFGLTHIEAGHGAVFGNLKPLVGVALSMSLLGESLSMNQLFGGLFVLAGIAIASRQPARIPGKAATGRNAIPSPMIPAAGSTRALLPR